MKLSEEVRGKIDDGMIGVVTFSRRYVNELADRIAELEASLSLADSLAKGYSDKADRLEAELAGASSAINQIQPVLIALEQERDALREAVHWALGERGDFPTRQEGQGAYWWRTELREKALKGVEG